MPNALPYSFSARLHPYFAVLAAAGVSLEASLEHAQLPIALLERPDVRFGGAYVYPRVLDLGLRQGIADFAYVGARRECLESIEPIYRRMLVCQPTVHTLLDWYFDLAHRYNGRRFSRSRNAQTMRLAADANPRFAFEGWQRSSDWSNIVMMLALIRYALGPAWQPEEITLQSRGPVEATAAADFPGTRILTGQLQTSFVIPATPLASTLPGERTVALGERPFGSLDAETPLPVLLGEILTPYLGEQDLGIQVAAEITGLSVRSLQRRLGAHGCTYSTIIDRLRYERAIELLKDDGIRITDIAYDVGYADPSHFTRAFKRLSGATPRQFRQGEQGVH